ncbi:MAG: polysaccharide biosynthesis tyrosine autokinase [Candidatus Omnitrophica bacterium]|nr:polysaccharide biosynthesis tyrosine autokinase [Candidatus Omnitrophota bacterium]
MAILKHDHTLVPNAALSPVKEINVDEEKTFADYMTMIMKRKEIILTCILVLTVLSAVYFYRQPNVYEATVQILVGKESNIITSPEVSAAAVELEDSSRYADYIETQFFIIKSRPLIEELIKQLDITKKYDYFAKEDAVSGDAITKVQDIIELKRVPKTQVVNLSAKFTDPKLCTQIANSLTDIYIKQSVTSKLYFSKEILKWLPQESEKIQMHTVYGQLQELSKKDVIESLPSVSNDPIIRQLKARKSSIEAEIKSLSAKYKEMHPVILKLKEDLRYVDDKIGIETQKIVDNLRAELAGKLQFSNIRVLQYAEIPTKPIGPKRLLGILGGAALGAVIGFSLVYILDYLDNTIRSQEDVEKYIKLPYLGHIPVITDKSKDDYEKRIIVQSDPDSLVAEAFKNIRTGIVFSAPPETLKAILVTSTIPSEGKSFTSTNLAVTLAMDGNKVLLVDSDMRRPTIHHSFKIENSTGLSNYLTTGNIPLDSVIQKTFVDNLSFVNAGPTPPNPSGLLGSARMEEFIKEAKGKFDRIVVDGPPLIGISDSIILSKIVDGVLLVIRFGTASRDVVARARQCLQEVGVNVLGVVLNDIDIQKVSHYSKYYHYYSRYYDKYGEKPSGDKAPAETA